MRFFILFIPGCPVWKSLKILFCNFFGITTLSLYRRTLSHSENTSGTFSFFVVIFCLILVIKLSFIASHFISRSVTGSSLMVLAIMFLISQSLRKAAINLSSKGSLYFGTNLDSLPAWYNLFWREVFDFKIVVHSVKSFPIFVAYWQYKLIDPFMIRKWFLEACGPVFVNDMSQIFDFVHTEITFCFLYLEPKFPYLCENLV